MYIGFVMVVYGILGHLLSIKSVKQNTRIAHSIFYSSSFNHDLLLLVARYHSPIPNNRCNNTKRYPSNNNSTVPNSNSNHNRRNKEATPYRNRYFKLSYFQKTMPKLRTSRFPLCNKVLYFLNCF